MYKEPIQRITMRFPKALLEECEEFAMRNPWKATDRSKAIHYLVSKGLEAEKAQKRRKKKTALEEACREAYEEAYDGQMEEEEL